MLQPPLTLALILITVAALLAGTAVGMLAWSILHPPRMTDGKAAWVLKRVTPGDLGMRFEETWFTVQDERTGRPLRLAGWWIPHPRAADIDRTTVLVHGYADAKVGAIAWAPTWQSLGYHILAIDLRAHGESEGTVSTGGFVERHDVAQVIDELRIRRPTETAGGIVLFGISFGALVAANATAVMTRETDDTPPVSALVLESPIADFRTATRGHLQRLGLGGPHIARAATRVAEWMSGADFGGTRTAPALRRAFPPVLLIVGEGETFLSSGEQSELENEIRSRGRAGDAIWRVPGAVHLTTLHTDPSAYRARLKEFLDFAVPPRASPLTTAER